MVTTNLNVSSPVLKGSSSAPETMLFPFLDLKAQFGAIKNDITQAVLQVLEEQHFILGPHVEALENDIAQLVDCEFGIGCASGSDALLLTLMLLGVEAGDEVVTTPYTFGATAGSIARLKARPVFVDIDPETYSIDPQQLAAVLSSRTRAIIPVHLFGLSANMKPIQEVAGSLDIPVIEDAAQAIGARYYGKPVGSLGALACFSFFPSKNLGGAGDGGMITTNDAKFADRLRMLRVHGCRRKYKYELVGINSRLDALQAAILRVKLSHLDAWTAGRRQKAARYRELFAELGLQSHVTLPFEPENYVHVYNQFVVRAANRDQLREHLRRSGIPSEVYYPSPLHLEQAYAYLGYRAGDFPNSETASAETLALPIFAELTEAQQRAVVTAIGEFYF